MAQISLKTPSMCGSSAEPRLEWRFDGQDDKWRARAIDLDHLEHARFEPVRLQVEQVPHQVVG